MTAKRMAATIAAALVVSEVLAAVVHGVLLDADYQPFRGSLLRAQAGASMMLLPVAHLLFITALVWVCGRLNFAGGVGARAMKIGLLGWCIGQAPLWMVWYAEQPWPGNLLVKQLALEFVSAVVVGLTIALVGGRRTAPARMPAAV